jgi:hypothetical protein
MYGALYALRKKNLMGSTWCPGVAVAFDDGFFFFKNGIATELKTPSNQPSTPSPPASPSSPSSPSTLPPPPDASRESTSKTVPTFVFINTRFGNDRQGNGSLSAPVQTRAAALKLPLVADAKGVVVAFEFDGTYEQICDWKSPQLHIWAHPPKNDRGDIFVVAKSSNAVLPTVMRYFSAETSGHCSAWIIRLTACANRDSELTQLRSKFISAAEALETCAHQEKQLRQHIENLAQQNRNLCLQLEQQQEQLQVYNLKLQNILELNMQKEQEREEALLQMAAAAYDRRNAAAEAIRERELRERLELERVHDIVRFCPSCLNQSFRLAKLM